MCSGNCNGKKDEGEPIPFSDFKLFDDEIPESRFPGEGQGREEFVRGKSNVPELVHSVILGNPHREHLVSCLISVQPKEDPDLVPATADAVGRYPHVLKELATAWGDPELFHLTISKYSVMWDRGRTDYDANGKVKYSREGFPRDVLFEIATLTHNHDRIFGLPKHLSGDADYPDPYGFNHAK